MPSKNIAAITLHHNNQPGFISINGKDHGEVEIIVRQDGDMNKCAMLTLSRREYLELVGQIVTANF